MPAERYHLGPFELDVRAYQLLRDGDPVSIQPKPLDLLARLVLQPGELVPHDQLAALLYPDVVVSEHALRNVVLKLRHALGDHADWIETVPRRGLRFAGPVRALDVARTLVPIPGNLPGRGEAFFGRADDLAHLLAELGAGPGLFTLVGLGGAGKTRLALEAAHLLAPELEGGTWFFDLSLAHTVEALCLVVAQGLGIGLDAAATDPVSQIGYALRSRGRALVLLDNLEQLVANAPTILRWVELAPEARFLGTSRVALCLRREVRVAVGPLAVEDGVALFVDRAVAPVPAQERAHVIALVQALEGLPLAIELAAARTRWMSLEELGRRLGDTLSLLSGGERDRPARHRSLQASLEGTWELLSRDARSALAQLSVFEGGFSLVAADAVLAIADANTLDLVQELVDASLVKVHPQGGRFSMLVLVRAFAARQLADSGPELRHGALFARLGDEAALEALYRHGGAAHWQVLGSESDNLLAALRRALARRDPAVAVPVLRAVWARMDMRGPADMICRFAEAALALPLDATQRGLAACIAGQARSRMACSVEAFAHYEAALAAHRQVGDRGHEGVVLGYLGMWLSDHGRIDEARAHQEAALALHKALGNRRLEGVTLGNLGILFGRGGGLGADMGAYLEAGLAIHREVGDRRGEGITLGNLGIHHQWRGRREAAQACYEAALIVHRELGNRRSEGIVLGNLAGLLGSTDAEAARAHYQAALDLHQEVGDRRSEGRDIGNLGTLDAVAGHWQPARARFTAALAIHRELGDRVFEGIVLGNLGNLMRECRHDGALAHYQEALSVHRELGSRRHEGILLGDLGLFHARRGAHADAAVALAEGASLLRAVDDPAMLATLLCAKAEAAWLAADADGARSALAEGVALGRPEAAPHVARVRALMAD
jgi:predicted ATPase/DNA-binding winged helix-turn-helix (wHTH) protein